MSTEPKSIPLPSHALKKVINTYQVHTSDIEALLLELKEAKVSGKLIIDIYLGGIGGVEFEQLLKRYKVPPQPPNPSP